MDFVNGQEKQILINGLKINYKIFGKGNIPIILLHGWGIDSDKYIETAKQFKIQNSKFKIFLLDLPGFGKSDKPPLAWGVDDYAELVKEFVGLSLRAIRQQAESVTIPCFNEPSSGLLNRSAPSNDKVVLIGHSFGGRIAIKFAAKYPEKIKALILTGAAGIKHPLTAKQKIFYTAAKIGKSFFSLPLLGKLEKSAQKLLYKAVREKDYFEAQGVMKETFKKVIAEDLTVCLDKIKTPTLLIWGKNDHSTSIADAYIMKEKIRKCKLEIVENANHGLPYKNSLEFGRIASDFINSILR